jgi:hypothetical protein
MFHKLNVLFAYFSKIKGHFNIMVNCTYCLPYFIQIEIIYKMITNIIIFCLCKHKIIIKNCENTNNKNLNIQVKGLEMIKQFGFKIKNTFFINCFI